MVTKDMVRCNNNVVEEGGAKEGDGQRLMLAGGGRVSALGLNNGKFHMIWFRMTTSVGCRCMISGKAVGIQKIKQTLRLKCW